MKRILAGASALMLAGCVLPGLPMMPPNYGGVGGTGITAEEMAAMQTQLKGAQATGAASAARPGDEAMTCEAIQVELTATMQDPRVQAAVGRMGERGKDQKAKMDAALAGKPVAPATKSEVAASFESAGDLSAIMPQLMRGQRLNELATAKNCAFLKGTQ
jgi:hypothetical protein